MEENDSKERFILHKLEVKDENKVLIDYTIDDIHTVRTVEASDIVDVVEHKMLGPYCPICGGRLSWQCDYDYNDIYPDCKNKDGIYSMWICTSCGRCVEVSDFYEPEDDTEEEKDNEIENEDNNKTDN